MPKERTQVSIRRENAQNKEENIKNAIAFFLERESTPHAISLRSTAQLFKCSCTTLTARIQGRPSKIEAADDWALISSLQSIEICTFASKIADRGFPNTHRQIAQRLNRLVQLKLGNPSYSLSDTYIDSWAEKNSHLISKYWTTSLTNIRANNLNEHTVAQYFKLLGEVDAVHKFDDCNIFSMDETNMSFGWAGKLHVFGREK